MPSPIDANVLNAGQLAEILNRMPPDATVVIPGYEGGLDNVIRENVAMTTIKIQHEPEWWTGEYTNKNQSGGQLAVVLGVHARERKITPPGHTFMWINPSLASQQRPRIRVQFQQIPDVITAGFVLRLNYPEQVLETYHSWGTPKYLQFPPLQMEPIDLSTFLDEADKAEFLVVQMEQTQMDLVHLPFYTACNHG